MFCVVHTVGLSSLYSSPWHHKHEVQQRLTSGKLPDSSATTPDTASSAVAAPAAATSAGTSLSLPPSSSARSSCRRLRQPSAAHMRSKVISIGLSPAPSTSNT